MDNNGYIKNNFSELCIHVNDQNMRILATIGDHKLGGKDWDDSIISHVAEMFEIEYGENPLESVETYQEIQVKAVAAKIQLSALAKANITVSYSGRAIRIPLTRQQFERMADDLIERCKSLMDVVLHEAKLMPEQIDTVLLVGGSTRMPMIREMLREYFGKAPNTSVNPDECVAMGAAILGAMVSSEQAGSAHKDPSFYGGIMKIDNILDVCSHSLGMVVLDEISELRNSIIIPKNTNIPCRISRDDYVTTGPQQAELDVYIVQGEHDDPRDCPVREAYEFYDIPPRPAGETRLKVTFEYNANGVIEVEAEDISSGKKLPKRKKEGEVDWDSLISPAPVPMDIALLIDCSGSMSGNEIRNARDAAIRFLDDIDPSFRIGLISFGDPSAHVRVGLTHDRDELRHAVKQLDAHGGTPMSAALAMARDKVLPDQRNVNVIVVLTDGSPNNTEATSHQADLAKQQDIRVIAVGVGRGVNSEYLKKIASTPEDYYFVDESIQLESVFAGIASRLATESSWGSGGLLKL